MWLGDVPSPAPCAVLGPLPGTVCGAGCWVPCPARCRAGCWSSGRLGDPGGCPPLSRGGCSSAMPPDAPGSVPGAPWDGSLVPSAGVEAQRPVEPRDSPACPESPWLRWEQCPMSALERDRGDGGGSGGGTQGRCRGSSRAAAQRRGRATRRQDPGPGLCPVLGAGWGAWGAPPNPEQWLLASFTRSAAGFAPCLSLPVCRKGASARASAPGCLAAPQPHVPAPR